MDHTRIKNAILGALVADAYALGAHWIYDGQALAELTIDWDELNDPQAHWHAGKHSGDFTHYGDQATWLCDYVADQGRFDIGEYRGFWLARMQKYDGYVDASSRETVAVLHDDPRALSGSGSRDLSIIGRVAPLLLVSEGRDDFLAKVAELVTLTHNAPRVLLAAQLLASILYEVVEGMDIEGALSSAFAAPDLQVAFDSARQSAGSDTIKAIRAFGAACGIVGGFEGVVHLLSSYDSYRQAMMINCKAGGDSAARGMVVGMIMGGAGWDIPEAWAGQWRLVEALT